MTYVEQLLQEFAAWLAEETDLKANTRQRYTSHLRCLLKKRQLTGLDQLSSIDVSAFLKSLPHGYLVKQHINAFKYFQQFVGGRLQYSSAFSAFAKDKPNLPPVSAWEPFDYDKVCRKINGMRNRKLKTAYRLMLHTGMRESEVASITKAQITFTATGVNIHLNDTKNNHEVDICCDNPYILDSLPGLIGKLQDGDRVFHCARVLREHALAYGFMCHDLRRAAVQDNYRENLESMPPREAKRKTADEMRHSSTATTSIYLSRKIKRK